MMIPARPLLLAALTCLLPLGSARAADEDAFFLKQNETVAFFGDSITQAGGYIVEMDAWIRANRPDANIRLINLGLASETVTGLTEPDHPFPRPNVHERIDRAIERVPFDTAFVCYGMNDGIYHPFSEERFKTYQVGLLTLVEKLRAAGKRVVVMTPPPFDAGSVNPAGLVDAGAPEFGYKTTYRRYDEDVITPYGTWVLTLGDRAALVIDLHTPVLAAIAAKRAAEPSYKSGDGVHPNASGHSDIALAILTALGAKNPSLSDDKARLEHVQRLHNLLDVAYRVHVGHLRPGERKDVPKLEDALAEAEKWEKAFGAAGAEKIISE
jgi:lysophospholipase L1-like esterase